jgi:DMSO/TMAO reductase YedYZ molybdopterin-dependent catalytic subunit
VSPGAPTESAVERAVDSATRRGVPWAALAGVAAFTLALGVAQLVAVVVAPRATPVVAVGDTVVVLAPNWAKDLAIALFGVRDKLFLVVLVAVVAAGLAAVAGLVERRRRNAGAVFSSLLGAVLAVAAATRPGADQLAWLPGLVAGGVALVVLPWLVRRGGDGGTGGTGGGPGGPRRRAVVLGGTVAAAGAAFLGAQVLGGRSRALAAARETVELPGPATPAPAVPRGATFDAVADLAPFRTPNPDFYRIDTAIVVPMIEPGDWRLRVHGLVEREVEVDLAAVLDRQLVEKWATLTCVSNEVGGGLIGNALWLGVPTADLLAEAVVRDEADMVLSTSQDGFTAGTPLEALTDGRGSLLAVGMNGEPLPVEHGFPARLVVPGLYGYVSATKWVVDLEVTRFADAEAYWTVRGWAEVGPVKLSSRIDRPRGRVARDADGTVVLAGVAWAQDVGVAAVEVRVDGGDWRPADLAEAGTTSTWRQWRHEWTPEPGDHVVAVRAVDLDGRVQTGDRADPFPSGATGHHEIRLTVT